MEQVWFYLELGFWHVLDLAALDHLLFIAAFSAPYGFNYLKKLIWWTTLFTIGHSLSLLGNYFYNLNISSNWIELLISVSILIACIPLFKNPQPYGRTRSFFSALILFFGIIHGFGFSRYFGMMVPQESATKPLISFAIGVEAAQITIILAVLILELVLVRVLSISKEKWKWVVGGMIVSKALEMTYQNWPW